MQGISRYSKTPTGGDHPRNMFRKSAGNRRGFTLIELMTAVVIVGVLASIGYKGFLKQAAKSHLSEGMLDIRNVYDLEVLFSQTDYPSFEVGGEAVPVYKLFKFMHLCGVGLEHDGSLGPMTGGPPPGRSGRRGYVGDAQGEIILSPLGHWYNSIGTVGYPVTLGVVSAEQKISSDGTYDIFQIKNGRFLMRVRQDNALRARVGAGPGTAKGVWAIADLDGDNGGAEVPCNLPPVNNDKITVLGRGIFMVGREPAQGTAGITILNLGE